MCTHIRAPAPPSARPPQQCTPPPACVHGRSIPPQAVDLEYAGWLGGAGLPFSIVFTKADKRKKGQPRHVANVNAFKRALLADYGFSLLPPSLVTSAATGGGKQALLKFIASLRVMWTTATAKGGSSKKGSKQKQPPSPA